MIDEAAFEAMLVAHSTEDYDGRQRGLPLWIPPAHFTLPGVAVWTTLPLDLWAMVGRHLERWRDMANAMLTCSTIRRGLSLLSLWQFRAKLCGCDQAMLLCRLGLSARVAYHLTCGLPPEFTMQKVGDMSIRKNAWRGTIEREVVRLNVLGGTFSISCSKSFVDDYGGCTTTSLVCSGTVQVSPNGLNGPLLLAKCTRGQREVQESGYDPDIVERLEGKEFSWRVVGQSLILDQPLDGIPQHFYGIREARAV